MARFYLGLGSNINPAHNLALGLDALEQQFGALTLSPAVESQSVGFQGDNFINLVAVVDTDRSITAVAQQLRQIEYQYGRELNATKFSGRTLDIDIVMVDQLQGLHEGIQLPRIDLFEHAYTLYPLSLLLPELVPPCTTLTTAQLWQQFNDAEQALWLTSFYWQGRDISADWLPLVQAQPVECESTG
ncbi:2-amino-4-hydroxy-6-hydroxymethyldihydropteridine diphosphokinase [Oceanospirillum multiglobuliferum]|uniref:2-amino-4-hydroxy-6-hydroxymethyldihydropteridine diphosphokinase n=2 Tax=Oceanospirillum multiglobuliferum TaxID=64969 RepID=A0A1V4T4I0_9GAMM|nr:2-amino-4-hydroxy-6-hydroxymethyldihydropteridine diphosphokinase [Oceanospirillum multiglobuliferum]